MNVVPFSSCQVNKDASLKIIHDFLAEKDKSWNHTAHKLAIIHIDLVDPKSFDYDNTTLQAYYADILDEKFVCQRTTNVEIYCCALLIEDWLHLDLYMSEFGVWSNSDYKYHETLKCWVAQTCYAKHGIHTSGRVKILDFSGYFKDLDNQHP